MMGETRLWQSGRRKRDRIHEAKKSGYIVVLQKSLTCPFKAIKLFFEFLETARKLKVHGFFLQGTEQDWTSEKYVSLADRYLRSCSGRKHRGFFLTQMVLLPTGCVWGTCPDARSRWIVGELGTIPMACLGHTCHTLAHLFSSPKKHAKKQTCVGEAKPIIFPRNH